MPFADVAALALPAHAAVAPVAATPWKTITVRPGDTLWHLAIANHTTVRAIVEKNRLALGGSLIHPGQKLLVPGRRLLPHGSDGPERARDDPSVGPCQAVGRRRGPRRQRRRDDERHRAALRGLADQAARGQQAAQHARPSSSARRSSSPGRPRRATPSTPSPRRPPRRATQYPSKTAQAVAESKAKLAAMDVPSRTDTAAMIRETATRNGVDPKLALAIGWLESGWYQRAVSYTNAVGVMQLMPVSQTWASQLAGRSLDRFDTQDNITGGRPHHPRAAGQRRLARAGHRRLLPGPLLGPHEGPVRGHQALRGQRARRLRPPLTRCRSASGPSVEAVAGRPSARSAGGGLAAP